MFTGKKVAQMAAFFVDKEGGSIAILKLIKLLYLADRKSIERFGAPISYDKLVSMDHGPVLSRTLDLIDGFIDGVDAEQWDEWISDRADHNVSLNKNVSRRTLDHLSNADIEVLEAIWESFGPMSKWEIRDYTHTHLDEWVDPHGSSLPISEMTVAQALGRSTEDAERIAQDIREQRELGKIIASAG